jgi:hypothetical protein
MTTRNPKALHTAEHIEHGIAAALANHDHDMAAELVAYLAAYYPDRARAILEPLTTTQTTEQP